MAYPAAVKEAWQAELAGIREKGIYKEERFIHSPQAAHITVEFPSGAALKEVVNLCANNYLGLSSHPEVVAAAHKALDERGYGMSSVRFICGTQDVHRDARAEADRVPRARRTRSSSRAAWTRTPASSRPSSAPEDVMISDRLVHASHRRRHPPVQGDARHLQALRHGAPGAEAAGAPGQARAASIITDGVFSHGRRPRAAGRDRARWPRSTTRWCSSTTATPPGSSARPAAACTSTSASWARSTSSRRRSARRWAGRAAAACRAGRRSSSCAGRRRGRTCSATRCRRRSPRGASRCSRS